jgi:hypothetical protein
VSASVLRGNCGKRYVSVFVGLDIGWLFCGGSKLCVRERCCWLTIWLRLPFLVVCGVADGVCCARYAGWFCEEATSWVVGASADRHSMAVVWGGLGDGIDIEPTESSLLFVRLEVLCE